MLSLQPMDCGIESREGPHYLFPVPSPMEGGDTREGGGLKKRKRQMARLVSSPSLQRDGLTLVPG